jgi:hypothetical protein
MNVVATLPALAEALWLDSIASASLVIGAKDTLESPLRLYGSD